MFATPLARSNPGAPLTDEIPVPAGAGVWSVVDGSGSACEARALIATASVVAVVHPIGAPEGAKRSIVMAAGDIHPIVVDLIYRDETGAGVSGLLVGL
jgi:hypothetical protein